MCGKYSFLNDGARQRAEKIVREAERRLAVRVDVSSSTSASTIAEKCSKAVFDAFKQKRNKSLKPAMFVMEITVLNGDPVDDMGKFSTKAHENVAKLEKIRLPHPCCTRINHRKCEVIAIAISASWLEVDPASTYTDEHWWKLYRR